MGRHQCRNLRRDEASELRSLALHCVHQASVPDRDRGLVGKRRHQFNLLVREVARRASTNRDRSDQLVLQEDRHTKERSVPDCSDRLPRVLRIGFHVGDLDRLGHQRDTPHDRTPVARVRMFTVELLDLGRATVRKEVKKVSLHQVELGILTAAQPPRFFDDLIEDRLQAPRPGDRAQHPTDRTLLLSRVLKQTRDLGRGVSAGHSSASWPIVRQFATPTTLDQTQGSQHPKRLERAATATTGPCEASRLALGCASVPERRLSADLFNC